MTALLFRDDAYLQSCAATVTGISERGGIILNKGKINRRIRLVFA